jgi:hypothetical protein
MKYKNGKFLHVCGFELCRVEFYGRLNQVYCSPECKQAHNNRKTSRVNRLANGADTKIRKAIRIMMKLFRPDEEGKMVISMVVLAYHAFPFDLPTTRIKDDRYRGELNSFGAFCFYRDGENFIFYKTQ